MGGAVGACNYDSEFSNVFLDDRLCAGETLLKRETVARTSFVEYIKSGEWLDKVSVFGNFVRIRTDEHLSLFERFGYTNTHCSSEHNKVGPVEIEVFSDTSMASIPTTQSDPEGPSPSKRELLADSYGAFSGCRLFEEHRTKCVMIAALLPVYLTTTTFKELAQKHGWEFEDQHPHAPLQRTKSIHNKQRSERLQEWLLGAAAMFDGSQLEEYLADTCGSWIEDYKRALTGLPVVMTLSKVDRENQESKVIFSNTGADSYPFMSDAAPRAGSSKLNRNMHRVFSTHMSPVDAEKVTKAVFDAETFRRSSFNTRGATQLRAVKPIFNAQGTHVYTLGLESQPFADPLAPQNPLVTEELFQQMEDLLSLLPMLVRC